MANRLVGNTYIIDSGQTLTGLSWGNGTYSVRKIATVHFYSTDTTGELKLAYTSDTSSLFLHVRNAQNQPFNLPYYFGGEWTQQLTPILVTAGTAFIHFI